MTSLTKTRQRKHQVKAHPLRSRTAQPWTTRVWQRAATLLCSKACGTLLVCRLDDSKLAIAPWSWLPVIAYEIMLLPHMHIELLRLHCPMPNHVFSHSWRQTDMHMHWCCALTCHLCSDNHIFEKLQASFGAYGSGKIKTHHLKVVVSLWWSVLCTKPFPNEDVLHVLCNRSGMSSASLMPKFLCRHPLQIMCNKCPALNRLGSCRCMFFLSVFDKMVLQTPCTWLKNLSWMGV